MIVYIGCFIVALVIIFIFYSSDDGLSSIPGPKGIPLFGNMLQIPHATAHLRINEWAKEFPQLMRLKLGRQNLVVVNDYNLIHTILVKNAKDFANRAHSFRVGYVTDNHSSIGALPLGEKFKLLKKVFLGHIKAYGTGLEDVQKIVLEVTSQMIEEIKFYNGRAFNVQNVIQESIIDMLCILTIRRKSKKDEKELIKEYINEGNVLFSPGGVGELVDRIKILQSTYTPYLKKIEKYAKVRDILFDSWYDECTNDSKSQYQSEQLINKLLKHSKDGVDKSNIRQIMVTDAFGAGVSTTSSTLWTLISILIHKPDVQRKMYQECRIANNKLITLEDQSFMPYHQATILEVLRYSSIVPFALPHLTTCDTSLAGYSIPKGTDVVPNFWALHHNEEFWDKPYEFNPNRYLDDNGDLVLADHPNRTHTMPFGAGLRVCAGEVFAKSRLFLMIANLVKNFEILPETTVEQQPTYDCKKMKAGLPLFPLRFKARLIPRQL